jgi:ABC-type ATPase with predicted acetyltransferase domain
LGKESDTLWKVIKHQRKENKKIIQVQNLDSKEKQNLSLNRYTYICFKKTGNKIEKQDTLKIKKSGGSISKIEKIVNDGFGNSSEVKIYPYYLKNESLVITKENKIQLTIKEITTTTEHDEIRLLSQFHYLGNDNLWGRKHFLIIKATGKYNFPPILGYIMLTSPSLLSRQRDTLLNWKTKEQRLSNIDRVVRITRVVVHPEFRGIGLGNILVKHAIKYCKDYWNVTGLKPWLIETVAEMSRYHPFFEKAGMYKFGETAGMNDVYYKPESDIVSGQGKGYYKASIERMKARQLDPKPYYFFPLHSKIKKLVKNHMMVTQDVKTSKIDKVKAPTIRIYNATIQYQRRNSWHEPLDVYQDWALYNKLAAEGYTNFKHFLFKLIKSIKCEENQILVKSELDNLREEDLNIIRPYINDMYAEIENMFKLIELPFKESNGLLSSVDNEIQLYEKQMREMVIAQPKVLTAIDKAIKQSEKQIKNEHGNIRARDLSKLRIHLLELKKQYDLGALSKKEEDVRKAFGVSPDFTTTVIRDFNIDIPKGSIVLIVGPSGSGKSTLLNFISGKIDATKGKILPAKIKEKVGILDLNFDPTQSIIDLIEKDTKKSIEILNTVGLSEAALYLKRREELSHGQRYRAATALLIDSKKSIWIADEFCAFLDPLTTIILSKGIRKIVKDTGVTFIAAVSHEEHVLSGLQPDIVIHMNAGGVITPNPKYILFKKEVTIKDIVNELIYIKSKKRVHDKNVSFLLSELRLIEQRISFDGKHRAIINENAIPILEIDKIKETIKILLWENDVIFHRISTMWNQIDHPLITHDLFKNTKLKNSPWSTSSTITQVNRRLNLAYELFEKINPPKKAS